MVLIVIAFCTGVFIGYAIKQGYETYRDTRNERRRVDFWEKTARKWKDQDR